MTPSHQPPQRNRRGGAAGEREQQHRSGRNRMLSSGASEALVVATSFPD